jgi:hypothetical protein
MPSACQPPERRVRQGRRVRGVEPIQVRDRTRSTSSTTHDRLDANSNSPDCQTGAPQTVSRLVRNVPLLMIACGSCGKLFCSFPTSGERVLFASTARVPDSSGRFHRHGRSTGQPVPKNDVVIDSGADSVRRQQPTVLFDVDCVLKRGLLVDLPGCSESQRECQGLVLCVGRTAIERPDTASGPFR